MWGQTEASGCCPVRSRSLKVLGMGVFSLSCISRDIELLAFLTASYNKIDNMPPLILHNVPDEELYVGDDGIQRPYAMLFPG